MEKYEGAKIPVRPRGGASKIAFLCRTVCQKNNLAKKKGKLKHTWKCRNQGGELIQAQPCLG